MNAIRNLACLLGVLSAASAFAATPIAKLSIPNPAANEYLGYSVATDGQRVLLGTGNGAAYLFNPFTQQQLAKVTLTSNGGTSVALQGNTGVVSSPGSARIFNFSNLPAVTSLTLTSSDGNAGSFGVSVDMSGDAVIVGAPDANSSIAESGAAYLFNRTTGAQFAKLTANDPHKFDGYGHAVAIDGNLAVVGAPQSIFAPGGAVYLVDANPNTVGNRQLNKFNALFGNADDQPLFGLGVDLAGGKILASAYSGPAYLWSTLGQPAPLPASTANRPLDDSISIDGTTVTVNFHYDALSFYDASGAFLHGLNPPAGSPIGFGATVAIGGDLVVVSAPGGAPNLSVVYVYRLQDILVPEPTAAVQAAIALLALAKRLRRCSA